MQRLLNNNKILLLFNNSIQCDSVSNLNFNRSPHAMLISALISKNVIASS